MGWLSKIAKKAKRVVKKVTPKPLRKPISKVTRQTKKITRPTAGFIKTSFTGKLDPKSAGALALINPVLAVNKYPRESLLAGGAVAGGSYLAGASASNTGAAGAVKAVAGSKVVDEAASFAVETAVMDKIAKKQKEDAEQKLNMSPPRVPEKIPLQSSAKSELLTPAVILGSVSLLVTLINRN